MDNRDLGLRPVDPAVVLDLISAAYQGSTPGSADAFKIQYLKDQCLSKFFDESTGDPSVLRHAAVELMEEAEAICSRINRDGLALPDNLLMRARYIFNDVLGDFSYEVFRRCVFTNGSTVELRRTQGDAFYKYASRCPTVTPRALPYASAIVNMTPLWLDHFGGHPRFQIVPGGKFDTVRKNAKTDREIEPQPTMNVYLQRAVGLDIRSKLFAIGIDLSDQSRNQKLARQGSIDGSIATLDLRMASSLISWRCVFELAAPDWFNVMDDLRTHSATMPKDLGGGVRTWERFSSMGNGFTFELETLIFYSIARAAIEDVLGYFPRDRFGVYGDDLIVPTECAEKVIESLEACGFLINTDKSFTSGPFRESCGGHYFKGVDVTPFYIRKPIDTLHRCCWLLNRIRKWSSSETGCDPRLWPVWLKLRRDHVPSCLLGGIDIDAIDAVYSSHAPRYRMLRLPSTVHCDGPLAVLRTWQRVNHAVPHNDFYMEVCPPDRYRDTVREWNGWSPESLKVITGRGDGPGGDPSGQTHELHLPFERIFRAKNSWPETVSRCRPASLLFPQECPQILVLRLALATSPVWSRAPVVDVEGCGF